LEISTRRDFRDTLTFTIDPEDAKDFDDALSYKEIPDGTTEIGIHIADVSHYVRPGTALDKEALKRGLSVYLVDRTIPMLPEVLSNDICSLNPNENKLTFSAVFIIDKDAKIISKWFGKTIINSDKRFTYEEAQKSITTETGEFHHELKTLNTIAKVFREAKFRNGAIDFEADEVKFKLDENGKPLGVYRKQRFDAHKLVEEFMLLANREVAEYIYKKSENKADLSSIYRIHDSPEGGRILELSIFLKALGYELRVDKGGKVTSKDINALLKKVEGQAEESLIKTATIRSMAKAVYDTGNIGHFGLAFEYYTHFTSPIRRYPDLIVHRILHHHLNGGKIPTREFSRLQKIANDSSEKEIRAASAERESIKLKQVEYMQEHIGETFEGIISGVTEWGIYIEEINTKCEGMVKLRDLKDDYYSLDEKNYAIIGTKSKKKLSLGGKVTFKVIGADPEQKTLDYSLV